MANVAPRNSGWLAEEDSAVASAVASGGSWPSIAARYNGLAAATPGLRLRSTGALRHRYRKLSQNPYQGQGQPAAAVLGTSSQPCPVPPKTKGRSTVIETTAVLAVRRVPTTAAAGSAHGIDGEVTLYTSVVDDTLKQIAADFEITVADLVFANKVRYPGLTKKSGIWAGTLLIIPAQQDDCAANEPSEDGFVTGSVSPELYASPSFENRFDSLKMVRSYPTTPHPRKRPRTLCAPPSESLAPAPGEHPELAQLANWHPAALATSAGEWNRLSPVETLVEPPGKAVTVTGHQCAGSLQHSKCKGTGGAGEGTNEGMGEGESKRTIRAGRVRRKPELFTFGRESPTFTPPTATTMDEPTAHRANAHHTRVSPKKMKTAAPPSESDPPKPCAICKHISLNNASAMVLCDGCEAEYHLGCLTPPVQSTHDLPEGEWFCSKCAVAKVHAKTAPSSVSPPSHVLPPLPPSWVAYSATDANHGGGQAGQIFYHNEATGKTQWAVPTHVPKDTAAAEPPVAQDQCAVCKGSTELDDVVCDGCDAEYHLHCLTPPAKSIDELPAGDWFCARCTVAEPPAKTAPAVATFKKPHRKGAPGTDWDESISKWVPIKAIKASRASKAATGRSLKCKTGAPTPVDVGLSSSEQAGLESIASTSQTWSLKQLTSYYLTLKAHGKDYTKIADRVTGKSREQVVRYTHNWASRKKGTPMEQWLNEFRAEPTEEEEEEEEEEGSANTDDSCDPGIDGKVTLHTSVVDETLKQIAADFEITVVDLVMANKARYPGLTKKSGIWAGTLLIIPAQQDDCAEEPANIERPSQATATVMDPGADELSLSSVCAKGTGVSEQPSLQTPAMVHAKAALPAPSLSPKLPPFPRRGFATPSPRSTGTLAQTDGGNDPYSSDLVLDVVAPTRKSVKSVTSTATAAAAGPVDPYSTDLMLDEVSPSPGQSRHPVKQTPTPGRAEAGHAWANNGLGAVGATDPTATAIGGRSARRRRTHVGPASCDKRGSPARRLVADTGTMAKVTAKTPKSVKQGRKAEAKLEKLEAKTPKSVKTTAKAGTPKSQKTKTIAQLAANKMAVSEPLLDLFDPVPENSSTEWGRLVSDPAGKVVIEDLYEDEGDIFC